MCDAAQFDAGHSAYSDDCPECDVRLIAGLGPDECDRRLDLVERHAGRQARLTVEQLVAKERSRINHLQSPVCQAAGYREE